MERGTIVKLQISRVFWDCVKHKTCHGGMLKWHYRSRHHSLIAVSNREFYDSRLFIVPSPTDTNETLGLRFHHVTDVHLTEGDRESTESKLVASLMR